VFLYKESRIAFYNLEKTLTLIQIGHRKKAAYSVMQLDINTSQNTQGHSL
jgi:hypothetical protein